MALTATQHVFEIELSDLDRGVYASVVLDVARHPSESLGYLVTRVLAYALEYTEGIAFSRGLSTANEPALWVHDVTGQLRAWIEVGTPSAERLHKASKACGHVVVYCHKEPRIYLAGLAGAHIHRAEHIAVVEVDRALVEVIGALVERRNRVAISVTEGEVYVDVGGEGFSGGMRRHGLG